MFNQKYVSSFLATVITLIILGLIFIYSSSAVYALEHFRDGSYFVKKQAAGFVLGIVGLIMTCYFPLSLLKRLVPVLFFCSLVLTMLTLFGHFGLAIHGSRRWLTVGPLTLQPSELLKHAFVVFIAYYISKKGQKLKSFTSGFLPLILIIVITSLVLLKQPDFGLTVTLAITAGLLLFIARVPLRFLLLSGAVGIPIAFYLILKSPYRLHRILSFLNPWSDPQGSGFQIIQSLIAIGSGGLFGLGIGASKQKFFYLPMLHTDFIFSIIAEETGFVGTAFLILLYVLFLYTGLKLAWSFREPFYIYTTIGFTLLTSLQAIINMFVATGLLPTKGVGLPFVSYGNSALVANLLMIGLILNFVRHNKA